MRKYLTSVDNSFILDYLANGGAIDADVQIFADVFSSDT